MDRYINYKEPVPSNIRMITDFAAAEIHTNNAGGPSERRFSGYYTMGLDEWLQGTYHVYTAED